MVVIVGVEANAGSDKRRNEKIAHKKFFMQRTLVVRQSRCQSDFYSKNRLIESNFYLFKYSTD